MDAIKMKIMFLVPKINLDKPSGGTLHYLDLVESMSKVDKKIEIYLVASGKKRGEKRGNITIISRPDINTSLFRIHKDIHKIGKINAIIDDINPDFLYYRTEPFELFPMFVTTKAPSIMEISYNMFSKSYDVSKIISSLWGLRNFVLDKWVKRAVKRFQSMSGLSVHTEAHQLIMDLDSQARQKAIFIQ